MKCVNDRRGSLRIRGVGTGVLKRHGVSSNCQVLDISVAGACVELERLYPVNTTVLLCMKFLPPIGRQLTLPAMVRWNHTDGNRVRHGLLFTYLSDEDLARLASVVDVLESKKDRKHVDLQVQAMY